jgi:hypothetical protein
MPFFRNPFARSASSSHSSQKEPLRDDNDNISINNDIININNTENIINNNSSSNNNNNNNNNNSNSKRRWFPSLQQRRNNTNNNASHQASLFCWLCDMRIATVLLNTIHITIATLLEILYWTRRFQVSQPPLLWIMALFFSGWGIFGAINFHLTSIFVSSLGLICLLVLYVAEEHLLEMTLLLMIIYCHIIYICEMQRGIMTSDQYAHHQYIDEIGQDTIQIGQDTIQMAQSYASEVGETTKGVVLEVTQSASNVLTPVSSTSYSNSKGRSSQNIEVR